MSGKMMRRIVLIPMILIAVAIAVCFVPKAGIQAYAADDGGTPYEVGTAWSIGETIDLHGGWFRNGSSIAPETKYRSMDVAAVPDPRVDGTTAKFNSFLPADKTIDKGGIEIDFPGGLMSTIEAEIPDDMKALDIAGIRLAGGTGTKDDPYTFGLVFAYPLWVGGVQVTSANMDNVLKGDSVNDGKVSFTPAEDETPATLALNGATITKGYNVTVR